MNRLEKRDALIEAAQAHWDADEFDKALECYDIALQLFSVEELDGAYFANFCNNLGACLEASVEYARAETLFEAARYIFDGLGNARDVAMVYLNLGLVLRRLAKFDRAAARLEIARRGFAAVGDRNGVARSLTALAMVQLFIGRARAARKALDEV